MAHDVARIIFGMAKKSQFADANLKLPLKIIDKYNSSILRDEYEIYVVRYDGLDQAIGLHIIHLPCRHNAVINVDPLHVSFQLNAKSAPTIAMHLHLIITNYIRDRELGNYFNRNIPITFSLDVTKSPANSAQECTLSHWKSVYSSELKSEIEAYLNFLPSFVRSIHIEGAHIDLNPDIPLATLTLDS